MNNEHFLNGLNLCQAEKYTDAIVAFNQALILSPLHAESYYNRGMARVMLGEYYKALLDFDEALNLSPNNAQIYGERAVTKFHLQDHRGALEDFNFAVKFDLNNPYRYSSRAYVRAILGDIPGAMQDYQKAIALDPNDAIAYNNLGLLEEQLGYQQKAQANFAKADQIADAGKTFEKPDIEAIVQNYEAKEKARLASLQLQKQPKGTGQLENEKPSMRNYWLVIREVFTSKTAFKEFINFVKGKKINK
jgi:tetratricopeptide (TPR) repeat protein